MNRSVSFTILEILLVLSIVLIISSMGIPYLINRNQYDLKNELERLEVIFYYLQQRAIATNTPQELLFDPIAQSYSFKKNAQPITYTLSSRLCFGFIPTVLGPPGDPKNPISQAITFPLRDQNLHCVKLLPNGKIYPGAIYISDKQKNELGALTCGVSQVSYIRKYLYKSNRWIPLTA